ncbi:proteolipid protein 2 [Neolamprologus brichardi]|uniref:proteolipid protein 2 n=1 Tax=Neolamprologus brichardi TaxID=32507 RepID=UPI0003EBFB3B|nr:proteolipid protein 2 [Neolamprologus brichardi]
MDSSLTFTSPQRRPHYLANASSRIFRLVSFIVIICYAASWCGGYTTVPICEMTFSVIFFGVFMMDLDKQFSGISWVWTDLFRAAVGAVLYIIISLIHLFGGSRDGACMAGAVFGLIAGLIFAYDTYTIFLQVKSNRQHSAAPTDDRV